MGGMDALKGRYLDNGMLDFLIKEREAGRIRNLGFSDVYKRQLLDATIFKRLLRDIT